MAPGTGREIGGAYFSELPTTRRGAPEVRRWSREAAALSRWWRRPPRGRTRGRRCGGTGSPWRGEAGRHRRRWACASRCKQRARGAESSADIGSGEGAGALPFSPVGDPHPDPLVRDGRRPRHPGGRERGHAARAGKRARPPESASADSSGGTPSRIGSACASRTCRSATMAARLGAAACRQTMALLWAGLGRDGGAVRGVKGVRGRAAH